MRRILLPLSVVCSVIYLGMIAAPGTSAAAAHLVEVAVIFKVVSIALLIALAASSTPRSTPLIAALAASCLGDFLLGVRSLGSLHQGDLFVFGLGAFLLAHTCYIALFSRNLAQSISATRKLGIVLVIIVLAIMLHMLWPNLGSLRIAVLIYALALDAMAITAQASRFPDLVAGGALLFVASDAMLAMHHFGRSFSSVHALVWISYYAAQLMITMGVIRSLSGRPAKSPAQ